jgi:hypothetical protein
MTLSPEFSVLSPPTLGSMASLARALSEGPLLTPAGARVYRDLFRRPQWFNDEVVWALSL